MKKLYFLLFLSLIILVSCGQKSDYQSRDSKSFSIDSAQIYLTAAEKVKSELYEYCDEHGAYCRFFAGEIGVTIDEYHHDLENANDLDAPTDENGDIIDPDAPLYVYDNSNRVSHTSESSFNAWQCSGCAVISKGTEMPSGGDFGGNGGCYVNYSGNHDWHKVRTNGVGWQCKRCGTTSYILREPCCGEFGGNGGCNRGGNHYWTRF